MSITNAIQSLVEFLGLTINDVEIDYDCSFYGKCAEVITKNGEEYHVYISDDDARDGAVEWNKSLIEDEGCLPDLDLQFYLADWWVDELASEEADYHSSEDYTYEFNSDGKSYEEAEKELRQGLIDSVENIGADASVVEDEIDSIISKAMGFSEFNKNEKGETEEECRDRIKEEIEDDPISYLKALYSDEDLAKFLIENNAIDVDKMADDCVSCDGVAHALAGYDGEEIRLDDGAVAYRQN